MTEIENLQRRIMTLEAVLRPLARVAESIDGTGYSYLRDHQSDTRPICNLHITLGYARAARRALSDD
jgi:hypothetical protein